MPAEIWDYPAAGRMPRGGVYFDNEDRAPAYDEDNYDINDNLEEFQVFAEGEIDWLKKQVGQLRDASHVITPVSDREPPGGGTCLADHSMIAAPCSGSPRESAGWRISIWPRRRIRRSFRKFLRRKQRSEFRT